jgi:hypothetical protein
VVWDLTAHVAPEPPKRRKGARKPARR